MRICLLIVFLFALLFYFALPVSAEIRPLPSTTAASRNTGSSFELRFENNSSKLTAQAKTLLNNLGEALLNDKLTQFSFLVAGHTAVNSNSSAFNLNLSVERANAIKLYLLSEFNLSPDRLCTIGLGNDYPLDPNDPTNAVNNRVQIANIGQLIVDKKDSFSGCSPTGFPGLKLRGANFQGQRLVEKNMQGEDMFGSTFDNANLFLADLSQSNLTLASFRSADLFAANLSGANLSDADFSNANLREVKFETAKLIRTKLENADLSEADLTDVQFEVVSIPRIETMFDVKGLTTLFWKNSPQGLTLLREAFKTAGMRSQERKITYVIKRSERVNGERINGWINYIFFEFTTKYGMSPSRSLLILASLILVFSIPYTVGISISHESSSRIFRVLQDDSFSGGQASKRKQRVSARGIKAFLWALYFSLLSAFHLGWRDINVGNWIARIHPSDWTLKSTGWIKVISGVQSLLSVYLLALWILTLFGRPFE